jgi:hypothetical protein
MKLCKECGKVYTAEEDEICIECKIKLILDGKISE